MSASWKYSDERSWIFLLFAFACIVICIHKGNQFANAAPNESTTTAHDVYSRYNLWLGLRFNYISCKYSFNVSGSLYSGLGDCPQSFVNLVKDKISDVDEYVPGANLTVYYDPANPSTNSLIEFTAASRRCYQDTIPWIVIGVLGILYLLFVAALNAAKNKKNCRQFVDAAGDEIYYEEIGIGSVFDGVTGDGMNAEIPYAATNSEPANVADFTSSPWLRELYLDVIKQIHPDYASNEADRALRERLTKEANSAYKQGDSATLQRVLEEYKSAVSTANYREYNYADSHDSVRGSH
jgi:hypothetical protein